MECTSEGNPDPILHWTAALLSEYAINTTFNGSELIVDVCGLTAWSQRSEKMNVYGTTRLMLTCAAQNTVRGQLRTATAQEIYSLTLPTNMEQVCRGEFSYHFSGNETSAYDIYRATRMHSEYNAVALKMSCLSLRLSHAGILSKWLYISSTFLHYRVAHFTSIFIANGTAIF